MILNSSYAENKEKMEKQSIDLTEEVTVQKFQDIVEFILKNGDRQTFCNKYNNNPHYKLEGFDIYLNPINQSINVSKEILSNKISDYDVIVIQDHHVNVQYYHLRLNENKVLLENHNEKNFDFIKNAFLLIYFPKIESELRIH
jgi:hypothetical protein